MAASVWIMFLYMPDVVASALMSRRVALTTPAVTVGWESAIRKPNGLPIAIAHSPTTSESLSPSGATGSRSPVIRSTARS